MIRKHVICHFRQTLLRVSWLLVSLIYHVANLGVVHNCQHLCISTESTSPRPAYYFLNVDQFVEHKNYYTN